MNRTSYLLIRSIIRGSGYAHAYRKAREARFTEQANLIHNLECIAAQKDRLLVRAEALRRGATIRESIVCYSPDNLFHKWRNR